MKHQPHRNGVRRNGTGHGHQAIASPAQQVLARGLQHHQAGRLPEAEATYRQVLAAEPANAPALHLLGVLAHQVGQPAAAVELISHAVEIEPLAASYHSNLGNALQALGRLEEAVGAYGRALVLKADHVDALNNQGVALQALGRPAEALVSFEGSLRLRPNRPETLNNVGVLLRTLGRHDEAEARLRRALKLRAEYPDALNNLAGVLLDRDCPDDAAKVARQAVALAPADARFRDTLGAALRALGDFDDAIDNHRQALGLNPDVPATWVNLAGTLQVAGHPAEAADAYRRALALEPASATAHSGLIFVLDLLPEAIEEAREQRRRFDQRFGQGWRDVTAGHANDRDPERRLRAGYVSADFRHHSAASAILPILRSHDRARVEVVCYSGVTAPDGVTEGCRSLADRWHDAARLSDDDLAALIRAERIDVLVDMSGHSAGNRLPVFGRKPAPVQATAWGYVAGTGLGVIDAFLADPVVVPPEERGRFAEEVLDLPSAICFEPPADLPPVGPLPAVEQGLVTFGSFHRLARLTREVLDLWAQVVVAVPHSRMVLKSPGLDAPASRERIVGVFGRHGVAPDRLTILGATSRQEHLAAYARVDLQIDTFPQSGGVTTLEGLAMGVPSVTLLGQGITGRISASFLTALGLDDLIADSPDAYVEAATGLAGDLDRLTRERATLRDRLLASPVGDARAYTRAVEDAYRTLWRRWCEQP